MVDLLQGVFGVVCGLCSGVAGGLGDLRRFIELSVQVYSIDLPRVERH